MVRLSRESWVMLAVAAMLVMAAVVWVYRPQGRRLKQLRTQITVQKLAMESDAKKAAVVPEMLRKVQEMKGRYKDFDRRLPRSKELGGFLQEITQIQSGSQLSEARMETGNPASEELYNTMPIRMRFRGSYLALADFLKSIDRMQRLTRVQRLVILSPKGDGDALEIELLMNIYFTKT
jgi:Tfp pilus assembly protein PilO